MLRVPMPKLRLGLLVHSGSESDVSLSPGHKRNKEESKQGEEEEEHSDCIHSFAAGAFLVSD